MRIFKKTLWPVMVTINDPIKIEEIELWLGDTMGAYRDRWNVIYRLKSSDFYFRNEQDATLFALRWL